MCLLGRTAIYKAISVKADSLYLLRRRPPNLLKVQILFLKGARDQIGGNLFWSSWSSRPDWICAVNQSRSGKIPSQDSGRPKRPKGRVLCLCDGCTPSLGQLTQIWDL